MILERLADLAAFDHVRYAQKACSNLAILDLFRRHGALVDAVSAGEIHRALAAGYAVEGTPPPIVYTADIFDAEALDLCVEQDIHVNCGSPDMIDSSAAARPAAQITLRINPGFGHGHSRKTNTGGEQSKHGIWHEQIAACLAAAARSDSPSPACTCTSARAPTWSIWPRSAGRWRRRPWRSVRRSRSISAGGGLPMPYRAGRVVRRSGGLFHPLECRAQTAGGPIRTRRRLEIEPGRYLVAESGYLVAEIRAVKRQAEQLFYLLDAGFNNLARPILYGAYHPMSIVPADGRAAAGAATWSWAVRCASRATSLPRKKAGSSARAAARGRSGRVPGDRVCRGLWVRDGFELQLAAAGRRGAHTRRLRRSGPPPATFEDMVRGEAIPEL